MKHKSPGSIPGTFIVDAMAIAIYIAMAPTEDMPMQEKLTNRTIRMSDRQWSAFKSILGDSWLRTKVEKEIIKQQKKLSQDPNQLRATK